MTVGAEYGCGTPNEESRTLRSDSLSVSYDKLALRAEVGSTYGYL